MTLTERLGAFATGMHLEDVPERVRSFARSQVLSQLAAARATLGHPLGRRLVEAFGNPLQSDAKAAACCLGMLTIALDYDDTLYAGHVSHSTVGVPVAYAGLLGLDGRRFLEAVLAGNECASRVVAGATLGSFRGQTAAYGHLVGATVARMRAQGASAERTSAALALACSLPPHSLAPAFFGGDGKALTATVGIRAGLDACDAAAAGLNGAADILEHPDGLLATFADVPLPDAVVESLGSRWHTETLSIKLYPACAYLDSALDAAVQVHGDIEAALRVGPHDDPHGGLTAGQLSVEPVASGIEEIVVRCSLFTFGMDIRSRSYIDGPTSPISGLQFSVPYPVAVALLSGAFTPADLASPRIDDPVVWDLAKRVRVEHDPDLTRNAVLATAPLGEALRQAGPRASAWLARLGGEEDAAALLRAAGRPVASFEHATKEIGAVVEVRLTNGRTLTRSVPTPLGASGPSTRRDHPTLARGKFLATGGDRQVADALEHLEDLRADELAGALASALTID
jgi:2-methylcitrate dehydratase PrpD